MTDPNSNHHLQPLQPAPLGPSMLDQIATALHLQPEHVQAMVAGLVDGLVSHLVRALRHQPRAEQLDVQQIAARYQISTSSARRHMRSATGRKRGTGYPLRVSLDTFDDARLLRLSGRAADAAREDRDVHAADGRSSDASTRRVCSPTRSPRRDRDRSSRRRDRGSGCEYRCVPPRPAPRSSACGRRCRGRGPGRRAARSGCPR